MFSSWCNVGATMAFHGNPNGKDTKPWVRPLLEWVPVDVLCLAFQFLDSRSLGQVSMVSTELRQAAEATAIVAFREWFGGDPPAQLPRNRLFLFVDQVRMQ